MVSHCTLSLHASYVMPLSRYGRPTLQPPSLIFFFFLDIIPQKVPAGVALARMKQQTQQQPEDPKQENKPET